MLKLTAVTAVVLFTLAIGPATAASPQDYDGVYVGRPIDQAGGAFCNARRDYSVVIADGHARLLYNRGSGLMLTGRVNSKGEIVMTGDAGVTQIKFTGTIDGPKLVAHSESFGAATCVVAYELTKQ